MAEGPRAQGRKGARPLGLRASDEDAPAPGQVLPQVGAMRSMLKAAASC